MELVRAGGVTLCSLNGNTACDSSLALSASASARSRNFLPIPDVWIAELRGASGRDPTATPPRYIRAARGNGGGGGKEMMMMEVNRKGAYLGISIQTEVNSC